MSIKIKGEKRTLLGTNASRRLRREDKVPAIFYGSEDFSVPLILHKKDIFSILKSETGENTIFKLSYNSETRDVMIKEFQKDTVTDEILHVDLMQIAMDKAIRVMIPIVLTGDAIGVKAEGGFVDSITRELEIECLPKDIPENIEIDISNLHLTQSIKIAEVPMPEGVKIISDPQDIIVLIELPTKEEVKEEVEEEEEVVAEEETPEVIKKEKEEESGKEE